MSGPEPDQRRCEQCGRRIHEGVYMLDQDEYWCESCADNEAERAGMAAIESLMENGPGPSLRDQQAAARKLK
jgi:hypothetical protein